ncbi:hypothetical protein [Streptomyces sp. NBC_00154]|uniref:hypothetical protein n=1 Tax=Streptomyces sp. NBC_00154 TaxID=2975670 RepID=UPI00224CC8C2|nr:hypothetical protein [Streptomyces sp. NBC_00154]MCX5310372.1 hypothetical protein [Streptomyces sp. NBC_00154]
MTTSVRRKIPVLICASCLTTGLLATTGVTTAVAAPQSPTEVTAAAPAEDGDWGGGGGGGDWPGGGGHDGGGDWPGGGGGDWPGGGGGGHDGGGDWPGGGGGGDWPGGGDGGHRVPKVPGDWPGGGDGGHRVPKVPGDWPGGGDGGHRVPKVPGDWPGGGDGGHRVPKVPGDWPGGGDGGHRVPGGGDGGHRVPSRPGDAGRPDQTGDVLGSKTSNPPDVVAPPEGNDYVGIVGAGGHQDTSFDGTRSPAATGTAPKYNEDQADLQMALDFVNSTCLNAGSLVALPAHPFDCLVDAASQLTNGWYPKDAADRVNQKYITFIKEGPVNPNAKKSIDCEKYSGSTTLPDECFVGSSKQK